MTWVGGADDIDELDDLRVPGRRMPAGALPGGVLRFAAGGGPAGADPARPGDRPVAPARDRLRAPRAGCQPGLHASVEPGGRSRPPIDESVADGNPDPP